MKVKYNIDITVINDCGTEFHICGSSSDCDYLNFSLKSLDFRLKCLDLQNEEVFTFLEHEKKS